MRKLLTATLLLNLIVATWISAHHFHTTPSDSQVTIHSLDFDLESSTSCQVIHNYKNLKNSLPNEPQAYQSLSYNRVSLKQAELIRKITPAFYNSRAPPKVS